MKHLSKIWMGAAISGASMLALVAATAIPAWAVDGNLPGGTSISVAINSPANGAIFPPGPVTVTGTASVGAGQPHDNTAVIYVLDVSGSTDAGGNSCGRIIDCEIAAAKNLNNRIVTDPGVAGTVGQVGAVVFAESAAVADVTPGGGDDSLTGPASNLGGTAPDAGDRDIEEVLASAFSAITTPGGVGDFARKEVGNTTSFAAAVTAARAVAADSNRNRKIVVFLSDGMSTDGAIGGVAKALAGTPDNVDIFTFAVGGNSDCHNNGNGSGSLEQITAATVPGGHCVHVNTQDLPNFLPGIIKSELSSLALSVNGPGGPFTAIGNAAIDPDLPRPGATGVTYAVTTGALTSGTHVLCVRASGLDGGGPGSVTDCRTVIINAAPVVNAGGPYSGQEGMPITIAGTVTDPDDTPATEWSVTPDVGVDTGATCTFGNRFATTTTITCTDDGAYNLRLIADDPVHDPVAATTTVTLTNVAPHVTISAPADGALFTKGSPVAFTTPFTDIGINDSHACSVDFNDGSPVAAGNVAESPGSGTCTISHAFSALGPHNVLVKITDDDGGSTTAVVRVVIYLPGGAFALEAKGLLLSIARTPNVKCPPSDARTQVAVNVPPLLSTGVLNASCTLDPATGTTTAKATVAGATLLGGLINLTAIESTSVASASGITRTSRVVGTINGAPIGTTSPVNIGIPGFAVVHLNESTTNASGQLVQNAVRVEVLGLLGLISETIILSETYLG